MTSYARALNSPMWPKPAARLAPLPAPTAGSRIPLYRQAAVFQFFDFVAGIPDPDEVLIRTGRTRADLRALLRDAEVAQALDTRHDAVTATPWRLEDATSEQAKFVLDEITPHVQALTSNAWQAVPYGYSVQEVVYARRGGRVGISAVHAPPFEWFRPLPDGSLRYFPIGGVAGINGVPVIGPGGDMFAADLVKPGGFILAARNPTYRNPYGESLLSSLYWPTTWRLQGWQLWLDFLDTFGTPIVVGKVHDYNAFVAAMQAQGVKRSVAWQSGDDKDALQTITASTAGEFERLEEALNRTIQKAVLGQTLTSDIGKSGGGSLALGKVHNEVREDKRRADIRVVACAGQRLVDALWLINRFPGMAPTFVMQDDVGLERERADRDAVLFTLGWRPTEEYIAENFGMEAGEDFTLTDVAAIPPNVVGEMPRESVKQAALAARRRRFTKTQQEVEDGVADVLARAPHAITPAALRSAIAAATDENDLAERLAVLLDRQDPAYPELLAYAQFAAQVLGYVHATQAPAAA